MRRLVVALMLCCWVVAPVAATSTPARAAEGRPVVAPTSAPLPPPPPLPQRTCAVTLPTRNAPPGIPEPPEPVYYDNGDLWTTLWPAGRVVFEPGGPGFVLEDGALGMKWPWIPVVPGDLAVEGRRLDAPAPPVRAEISEGYDNHGRFFPTYLIFPSAGCWEVTGRVGETSLTFVTLVVQVGDGPNWHPAAP